MHRGARISDVIGDGNVTVCTLTSMLQHRYSMCSMHSIPSNIRHSTQDMVVSSVAADLGLCTSAAPPLAVSLHTM